MQVIYNETATMYTSAWDRIACGGKHKVRVEKAKVGLRKLPSNAGSARAFQHEIHLVLYIHSPTAGRAFPWGNAELIIIIFLMKTTSLALLKNGQWTLVITLVKLSKLLIIWLHVAEM